MIRVSLALLLGIAVGLVAATLVTHQSYPKDEVFEDHLRYLVENSSHEISEENWRCENVRSGSLGSLLSHMIVDNARNTRNKMGFGCVNETCAISLSYCRFWQFEECSELFIKYNMAPEWLPDLASLQCISVP